MKDSFGRTIDYIRISITDRCNLRCVYCMPEEGVESMSHSEILTFDELTALCRFMAKYGLEKIKITGGEPLVRKGVETLIAQLKGIEGIRSVTITTNGVLLEQYYHKLVNAGIDCITVSLDTLNPDTFQSITRRNELDAVLRGIALAQRENLVKLKLNTVPMAPLQEQELCQIARFAQNTDTDVRFIEVMPIGMGCQFEAVGEQQVREVLERNFGRLTLYPEARGNGPSVYYSLEGFQGKIGFISAVSHKFCDSCNRVRLTADGYLKTCLQYDTGVMLRPYLREWDEETLFHALQDGILAKPKGHHFELQGEFTDREHRKMSQIGG